MRPLSSKPRPWPARVFTGPVTATTIPASASFSGVNFEPEYRRIWSARSASFESARPVSPASAGTSSRPRPGGSVIFTFSMPPVEPVMILLPLKLMAL